MVMYFDLREMVGHIFVSFSHFAGTDFDSIRTAYKRLALKWHPDKHDSSADSIKVRIDILSVFISGN